MSATAALATLVLLGGLWLRDRTHRWEQPRWESGSFVSLRAGPRESEPLVRVGPGAMREARPRWLVPVNPRCENCLVTLRRLHVAWAREGRPEELIALVVDTRARPSATVLRALPPVPVWWDRRGIWRRRWGHRLYGEVIEFDASGRFVRTAAAGEILRSARRLAVGQEALPDARRPAPTKPAAPATRREGGT